MLKSKVKNMILMVMVVLCIYLSSNVWLKLPEFFRPHVNDGKNTELTITTDIWQVLRPVKNIIKYDDNYTVLYSDDKGLWEKAIAAMKIAFSEFSSSHVIETAAFPTEYLKFDFNSNLPVEIFVSHMKIENEDINRLVGSIKNVIIDLDNINSIYLYNGENTIKISNDKINTKELADLVKSVDFEDSTKFIIGQKIGDETIQVPVPLEQRVLNPVFVQSELDVFDIEKINEIAKDYFKNEYDYVRKSVEVNGNLVYVYRTEKILKINEEGLLNFQNASIESENGLDVYESFLAAVNFTEEFLGFPDKGYLSSVENINIEGREAYKFIFSYNILERPILFSQVRESAALEIDVIANNIVSYKRFIRNIDDKQMDKMAEIQVLPAIDVISKNIDISEEQDIVVVNLENELITANETQANELRPIKKEMIKEINNIYLGYFDLSRISKEQVLRVVWVVETNEKTFIFNAITGFLIEEWEN